MVSKWMMGAVAAGCLLPFVSLAQGPAVVPSESAAAVAALQDHLSIERQQRRPLTEQPFAHIPLAKTDAATAVPLLVADHQRWILEERAEEMETRRIVWEEMAMPFSYQVYGDQPPNGRSLFISMHGGGGAPKRINDQQWENQKRLYVPSEGVYVAPRAPTDTWNLWHQSHIDLLFRRLIENLIVFEQVDPDRVYLLGYSAGGDGVYQLAPRMADSFAAASMMAGHPNETSPLGLRNLPFSLHVGAHDNGYERNDMARQWSSKLAKLRQADPEGYLHWAKIYEGKGHWLDREDAAALGWMAKFRRQRFPQRIVWKQDDVTHERFYWLAVADNRATARSEIIVQRDGQRFEIEKCDVGALRLLLNDDFVDLDQPIVVTCDGQICFQEIVPRTIALLARTLRERGDPGLMFSAQVSINHVHLAADSAKQTDK